MLSSFIYTRLEHLSLEQSSRQTCHAQHSAARSRALGEVCGSKSTRHRPMCSRDQGFWGSHCLNRALELLVIVLVL